MAQTVTVMIDGEERDFTLSLEDILPKTPVGLRYYVLINGKNATLPLSRKLSMEVRTAFAHLTQQPDLSAPLLEITFDGDSSTEGRKGMRRGNTVLGPVLLTWNQDEVVHTVLVTILPADI